MPTLGTGSLVLRPMKKSDIEDYVRIFADPKVIASFDVPSFNRRQLEQWIQRNLTHQDKFGYGLFSVILKINSLLIGNCGLQRMKIGGVEIIELGYEFHSDSWNKRHATEAASAVRDFAFHQSHLTRLTSLVREGNLAAARVSEKIGMTRTADVTQNNRHYWQYVIERNQDATNPC
jgi:RimJ/RimL family protein N-acetyltransferase